MSPRLDVADVSTATEGSAPWPPGRTMSGPNEGADGCFAGDGLAPAWGAIASVATADRTRAGARRRSRLGAATGGELTATGCLPWRWGGIGLKIASGLRRRRAASLRPVRSAAKR